MTYAIALTPEAEEDVVRLVTSLEAKRRGEALKGIEVAFSEYAAHAALATDPPGRPYIPVHFDAGGVRYYWAATAQILAPAGVIIVTHVYRLPL